MYQMNFNTFALLDACFLWIIGLVLGWHTLKHWNESKKKDVKYSEILQVILFFVMGIYVLYLIDSDPSVENKYYGIMFAIYGSLAIFFLLFNVFPNMIRKRRDPHFREDENYDKFLEKMRSKYSTPEEAEKADKVKDLSRKLLHVLQFSAYVILYEYSIQNQDKLSDYGLEPFEFRNFLLFLVGGFFWIMMMTGDLFRMEKWIYLPRWAHFWFENSLEPEREAWTINSASSILLANFLFLHPNIPMQVFFASAFASCIGDALASVVGKNLGKHKLDNVGNFPNKSWEGTIAGALSTAMGVIIFSLLYPIPDQSLYLIVAGATLSSIAFMLIDMYVRKIADNLLNNIVIGLILLVLIKIG